MSDNTHEDILFPEIDSTIVEPKKRRGRPPKNPAEAAPKPETDRIIEIPKPEDPKPIKRKSKKVATIEDMAKQVYGWHQVIAMMTGVPEIALQPQEAESLARAILTFSEEFDFNPSPKIMAAIGMIGTAGMIYIPRAPLIMKRIEAKKQQAKPKVTPNEEPPIH